MAAYPNGTASRYGLQEPTQINIRGNNNTVISGGSSQDIEIESRDKAGPYGAAGGQLQGAAQGYATGGTNTTPTTSNGGSGGSGGGG